MENPTNGGEGVTNAQLFPEKSSALVEFSDYQVVDTYLAKKLVFNERPITVFPYYVTLGIALYGKEKPLRKLLAPFWVALHPFIWKIMQKKHCLIGMINYKRGR